MLLIIYVNHTVGGMRIFGHINGFSMRTIAVKVSTNPRHQQTFVYWTYRYCKRFLFKLWICILNLVCHIFCCCIGYCGQELSSFLLLIQEVEFTNVLMIMMMTCPYLKYFLAKLEICLLYLDCHIIFGCCIGCCGQELSSFLLLIQEVEFTNILMCSFLYSPNQNCQSVERF